MSLLLCNMKSTSDTPPGVEGAQQRCWESQRGRETNSELMWATRKIWLLSQRTLSHCHSAQRDWETVKVDILYVYFIRRTWVSVVLHKDGRKRQKVWHPIEKKKDKDVCVTLRKVYLWPYRKKEKSIEHKQSFYFHNQTCEFHLIIYNEISQDAICVVNIEPSWQLTNGTLTVMAVSDHHIGYCAQSFMFRLSLWKALADPWPSLWRLFEVVIFT